MFEELLAYLDRSNVRFVVTGSLAVVLQGYVRLAAGVDVAIDLAAENVIRAVDALTARGLRPLLPVDPRAFANDTKRRAWVETRNLEVFSMRDEHNPLLTVQADTVPLGGRPIRLASIEHLIRMKHAAARPQDALDIDKLTVIARRRRGQ